MLETILSHFPPGLHPLTLVHDPDNLQSDELLLAELSNRGFQILNAQNIAQLFVDLGQLLEFSVGKPVIVVSEQPANHLPYNLWQRGHKVSLALNSFFPKLSYPVIKALSSDQLWELSKQPEPADYLGRKGTAVFLLEQLFAVDWNSLKNPAGLISWLSQYHLSEPMPTQLTDIWLDQVRNANKMYLQWPIAEWLHDKNVYQTQINSEWRGFVGERTGQQLGEIRPIYRLPFKDDHQLQGAIPGLIHTGTLQPITLESASVLPNWALAGIRISKADYVRQRGNELLAWFEKQPSITSVTRWAQWQATAVAWAELTMLRYHPERLFDSDLLVSFAECQKKLDDSLESWLIERYAPLAIQSLPVPHHLYHIPNYMAFERRRGNSRKRVALLVLDGLSYATWLLIERKWKDRNVDWRWSSSAVLAQVPSLTAISRQALVSGKRPAEFKSSMGHNRAEERHWTIFWEREDVPSSASSYTHLKLEEDQTVPAIITSSQFQALCFIYNGVDNMVHGASQGLVDVHASLSSWLLGDSYRLLEEIISELINNRYSIYLTSDHGHTEAWGIGQPTEGLTVQTRSKRARVYASLNAALAVQEKFPQTVLWESKQLLPNDVWILLTSPQNGRRTAFTTADERVVTHGGISVDEMIVPFVRIAAK